MNFEVGLDYVLPENNSMIKINSFYDVFNEYNDEDLERYKYFSGLPKNSKYNEILDMLKKDAE